MKAYSQGISKTEFLKELRRHQAADDFIRGTYGNERDDGKGCAVGCSLKSVRAVKGVRITVNEHKEYETHLGIPEWLARVEDRLFEGMSGERSKAWPVEFANAINTGSDLEKAKGPFLIMVLKSALKTFDREKFPDVKKALDGSIALWKRKDIGSVKWNEAADAARTAARTAADAAEAAARTADAAWTAAEAAARTADAAWTAAWTAWAAEAAWTAAAAATSAADAAAEAAARTAARTAADAARTAARTAAEAARSEAAARTAAWAAEAARTADAAWTAARAAAEAAARTAAEAAEAAARTAARTAARAEKYEYFADELLKILRKCK